MLYIKKIVMVGGINITESGQFLQAVFRFYDPIADKQKQYQRKSTQLLWKKFSNILKITKLCDFLKTVYADLALIV